MFMAASSNFLNILQPLRIDWKEGKEVQLEGMKKENEMKWNKIK